MRHSGTSKRHPSASAGVPNNHPLYSWHLPPPHSLWFRWPHNSTSHLHPSAHTPCCPSTHYPLSTVHLLTSHWAASRIHIPPIPTVCLTVDQVRISGEPTTKAWLWVWMVSGLQCSKTVHRVSDDASETVIRSGKHHPKPPSVSGPTQKHTDQETESSHLKDRAPQQVFPSCGNSIPPRKKTLFTSYIHILSSLRVTFAAKAFSTQIFQWASILGNSSTK